MSQAKEARDRTLKLRSLLVEHGIGAALITDEDAIAYYAGFWGYLGMAFGRPTCLLVHADDEPVVITPLLESELVGAMTWVADVRTCEDAGANTWQAVLQSALHDVEGGTIGIEADRVPVPIRNFLGRFDFELAGVSPLIGGMRMIKSPAEIAIMRQAGEVAATMMAAARDSLAVGVTEYESALAIFEAGTRKSAELLEEADDAEFVSPVIHGLPILQSGANTSMVHRRAGLKRYAAGDAVYFCFCNLVDFRHYRLGFDRLFFVARADREAARVQQAAIDAQQAAVRVIRPGIAAEEVACAADAVYAEYGFAPGYRTGRAIGLSYLERPELKAGDTTILEPGMTFCVDGGVSVDGARGGRIGDSIVVTATGCEYLTEFPREITVV